VDLASHALVLAIFLSFVLGASELALRKAVVVQQLLLFARFMFIARAVPRLGPMVTMLFKVAARATARPSLEPACLAACTQDSLQQPHWQNCGNQRRLVPGDESLRGRHQALDRTNCAPQVALNMGPFLLLVFLLLAGSGALLNTLLSRQAATPAAAGPPLPQTEGGLLGPAQPEQPSSSFQTFGGSLLQLFVIMMGGVVRTAPPGRLFSRLIALRVAGCTHHSC
jgi:hypothetical protein